MPVTNVTHDLDDLTLTITASFAAPVERIWQVYADARQLERVWGPPTYPATFVDHQLAPGTRSTYYMTGPEGEKHAGVWDIIAVNDQKSFSFEDAFSDTEFNVNPDLPVSTNVFNFSEVNGETEAVYVSTYASAEALQQVLDMGAVEGATAAINQIDELID